MEGGDGEGDGENEWGQGVGGDVLLVISFYLYSILSLNLINNRGSTAPREKKNHGNHNNHGNVLTL